MTKTILKSAAVAASLALMAGCASQGADMSKTDQAMRKAESAQAAANQAQQTATEALQTAREAKKNSQANSERINRMFKSSQAK